MVIYRNSKDLLDFVTIGFACLNTWSCSSDAAAEVMGYVRRIFAKHDVIWQTGELGKVDQGGGGTVACYMANRNIETVDAGVPVLSMHAPMEIVSKLDTYMTFKGMKVFYEEN